MAPAPCHNPHVNGSNGFMASTDEGIPVVDLSMLVSGDDNQRSKIVSQLGEACRDWGCFVVINHGIPESLYNGALEACHSFFTLAESEKEEFRKNKHPMDGIRLGNIISDNMWSENLKSYLHPVFNCPQNPRGFSETLEEFCEGEREVLEELLKGISESLGLHQSYISKSIEREKGLDVLVANYYPSSPERQLKSGLAAHTDCGVMIFVTQNQIGGLQVLRNGTWHDVNAPPSSIMVLVGDQMEILTNGKYRSVLHKVVVNSNTTRVSMAIVHGPSTDKLLGPAPELMGSTDNTSPANYREMKYGEYVIANQTFMSNKPSTLELVRMAAA